MKPQPPQERLTPRQQERRARILDNARELVAEHGYDGVSMRTIARESGVTEKTLYNIFGSKDELIAIAARERTVKIFDEAADKAPAGSWAALVSLVHTVAEKTHEQPNMARALIPILTQHPELVGLEYVYARHVPKALEEMQAEGLLDKSITIEREVRLIRLAIISATTFWNSRELADDELLPYLKICLAESLYPLASDSFRPTLHAFILSARNDLHD
ncbi:TetR/AcrR family transcriptional regulator [Aquisediminimonas sediminicola]|uniref:TetR/AcrR family transcriptional regulator n=1 Tax=Alteraquisediminimonas sediminicola TaxID=2676787 RepID=UPI001C8D9CBE|nr:TetR/AcrR family transcriptional regulator [Aquisediminimonas sediminicola]